MGTRYMVPGSVERMPWQLTMRAHRWESIVTPALLFYRFRQRAVQRMAE